jgi:hypothetical protein
MVHLWMGWWLSDGLIKHSHSSAPSWRLARPERLEITVRGIQRTPTVAAQQPGLAVLPHPAEVNALEPASTSVLPSSSPYASSQVPAVLWRFQGQNLQSTQAAYQAQHVRDVVTHLREQALTACEKDRLDCAAGEAAAQ